ncbi:MAG: hypothetical protein KC613_19845, partial [Myxococcales bacterium]|nr:hypothetical protein [Myxococcales bacterium]
ADSVGLGKTITALGTAWSLRRAHAITDFGVLAPRKLHEQWAADAEAIGLDPNSFSRLNRHVIERKPLEDAGLEAMLGRYQLLLVDEAHETLRNRRNKLWEHLNHWLRGDPDRMVLLISATPWNNSREDIYNYLAPAWVERTDLIRRYPGLGTPAIARTLHLYDPIDSSHARDFGELDQTTYNQLFGAVFVQRTRHQIARIYGSDAFPTRRVHADATPAQPEHAAFFQQLARTLGQVQIAYREPFSALLRALNPDEATGQSNLHRSFVLQLYKRAESSLFALAVSLAGVERRLREFRRALEVVRDHSDPVAALRDWLREVYLRTDQITDAMEQGDDDDALLQVQHSRAEDNRRANVEAALRDLEPEAARAAVGRLIDLDV